MACSFPVLVGFGDRVQVPFEVIEAGRPHPPVGLEPLVDRPEWLGAHSVEAALSVDPHVDEPCFAKDAKVLGDRRLAEAEAVDELADGPLGPNQQVKDPAAVGLREYVERGGHCYGLLCPIQHIANQQYKTGTGSGAGCEAALCVRNITFGKPPIDYLRRAHSGIQREET
jgi:hypothetical protein